MTRPQLQPIPEQLPFYRPQANEIALFEYAWRHRRG